MAGTALTPYGSLTALHTHIDAYTETSSGFPAHWNQRTDHSNIFRPGLDGTRPVASGRATLLGRLEGAWRNERKSTNSTGQMLGLDNFDLPGTNYRRSWLRVGEGAEGRLAGGTASLMLNGTTQGGNPNYRLSASYRLNF